MFNFFGFGNNTENFDDDLGLDYNRVKFRQIEFTPSLVWRGQLGAKIKLGLSYQNISVEETDNRFVNTFYQQKRDLFLSLIKDARFEFTPSNGTYFQLLNFKNITNESDYDFAVKLTKAHKIASVPISVFNENGLQSPDFTPYILNP